MTRIMLYIRNRQAERPSYWITRINLWSNNAFNWRSTNHVFHETRRWTLRPWKSDLIWLQTVIPRNTSLICSVPYSCRCNSFRNLVRISNCSYLETLSSRSTTVLYYWFLVLSTDVIHNVYLHAKYRLVLCNYSWPGFLNTTSMFYVLACKWVVIRLKLNFVICNVHIQNRDFHIWYWILDNCKHY